MPSFAWLSILLVVVLCAAALAGAALPVRTETDRRRRLGSLVFLGALTLAATVWQSRSAADRIAGLERQDRSPQLTAQVESLQRQLDQLKETSRGRSLSANTAAKLADYLRGFGSHKVIVSCAPDDIEAYHYATQIADVLRAANWDARGPEATTIFGNVEAMGINLYNDSGHASETVKILLDAMVKFGIPYQSRVPPSQALPDNETVELFIGSKPSSLAALKPN
ncbi:MAG TPA: hypothetical protein VMF05_02780 [Stellaceae bacterium]|nr:hypothetical protein [Stellaceae bacterium]